MANELVSAEISDQTQDLDRRSASLARHEAHCTVCRSDDRQAIEAAWLTWTSPSEIERTYDVSARALGRHVDALALRVRRAQFRELALERLIERGLEALDPTTISVEQLLEMIRVRREEHPAASAKSSKLTWEQQVEAHEAAAAAGCIDVRSGE